MHIVDTHRCTRIWRRHILGPGQEEDYGRPKRTDNIYFGNNTLGSRSDTYIALEPDSKTSQISYLLTLGRHW